MINHTVSSMSTIHLKRNGKRYRESSYDRSGGNDDFVVINPGESKTIGSLEGQGLITHLWMTMKSLGNEQFIHRKILLQCYWDDEEHPSVNAPVGDFFGMGHGLTKDFVSAPLQMSPDQGRGLNSWWPMPFMKNAILKIVNESNSDLVLYFYIDYEIHDNMPDNMLHFHARFHREYPTQGISSNSFHSRYDWLYKGKNTDGANNYVILEAKGAGHYCGANINIFNLNGESFHDWIGEGDDMIFIDDEPLPPRLHGTGTEDYINMAYCPSTEYNAPFHGIILAEKENWKGRTTYYRYHIQDPIMFEKSIRVTIEHGHNNHRSDDWSSTAYWYQTEPHKPFGILSPEKRMPIDPTSRKFGPEERETTHEVPNEK